MFHNKLSNSGELYNSNTVFDNKTIKGNCLLNIRYHSLKFDILLFFET